MRYFCHFPRDIISDVFLIYIYIFFFSTKSNSTAISYVSLSFQPSRCHFSRDSQCFPRRSCEQHRKYIASGDGSPWCSHLPSLIHGINERVLIRHVREKRGKNCELRDSAQDVDGGRQKYEAFAKAKHARETNRITPIHRRSIGENRNGRFF